MSGAGHAAEWRAARAILAQPVLARRAKGSLVLSWTLLVLSVLGALAGLSDSPHRLLLFSFCTATPLGMLMLMWWIYLCGSLTEQCNAQALRLVPAMAPRARRVLIGAWLAIVLVMTALVGGPLGHPVLVALVTGLVLLEFGVTGSFLRMAMFAGSVWLFSKFASDHARQVLGTFLLSPAALVPLGMVLVFNARSALRRQFPSLSAPSAESAPVALTASPPSVTPSRESTQLAAGSDTSWRARLIAFLCAAPRRQPAFLEILGPSSFSNHRLLIVLTLLLCAGLRLRHALHGGDLSAALDLQLPRGMMIGALLLWQAAIVLHEARRFSGRHVEQSLLTLTPAAPASSAMNAVLACFWRAELIRTWSLLTVTMLCGAALLGAPADELARAMAVATCPLVLAGYLFRDLAHAPAGESALLVLAGYTVLAVSATGAAVMGFAFAWLPAAMALASVSLAWAAWRWRRMLGAAPVLPAGRFG